MTQQAPFWGVLLLFVCVSGNVNQKHSADTCAAAGTCDDNQRDRSESNDADNSFFLQATSSVTPGCPDNIALEAEKFWKDYFLKECRRDYDDLSSDIQDQMKNSFDYRPLSTDEPNPGCRIEAVLADHGALIFEVGKKGSAKHQFAMGGTVVEKDACNLFEQVSVPVILDLSADKVEEILAEVKKVYALECKDVDVDELVLATDLSMKPLTAKRADTLPDGSTEVSMILPLMSANSPAKDFTVVFSEVDLTDEEEILENDKIATNAVQQLAEESDAKQGQTLLQGDDTTGFIQRRVKVEPMKIHSEQSKNKQESPLESSEQAPGTGAGDTLADLVGKLTILDEQISPRLCSICGECVGDEYAKLLQDDDEEGKIKEQQRLYPELQSGVPQKLQIPHAGSKEERMPPPSPGRVETKGIYRKTAAVPGMGDNFHSMIMPKRTAEDHREVWARSRALLEEFKAPCYDTPGWQNNHGFSCANYQEQGWCRNGNFAPGYEWTGSHLTGAGTPCANFMTASKTNCAMVYNYPAQNCVSCGKCATAENLTIPEAFHFYDSPETAGCFQPAYDQGKCGSCWAFASLGALEKQMCMRARSNVVASLSREMLVRCSEQNNACGGGNADKAYEDLMEIGGVFSTDCLPYQGEGSKHCPAFAYSWFGQGSVGKTGKFTRIDQELQKSCTDHTRYSNRPPMGKEWDMPFKMMYEARFGAVPDLKDTRLQSYRRNFAKTRSRDRVPSWWLYGEQAMKAAIVKYGSIYASFMVRKDFKGRQCPDGCWPPGTVYGEEPDNFKAATCGCPSGHAIHIVGYGEDIQETGLKVPYWLIENSWGTEKHGDIFGEDPLGVKGFGKDPFTELHPMGVEDQCVFGGWAYSSLPMVGGCGGNQQLNIRDDVEKTGGDPDGMWFSLVVNGQDAGQWRVQANSQIQFNTTLPFKAGVNNYTLRIYSMNHTKLQGAFDVEQYGIKATSLRCRGKGFRYSFTTNDTKATLSWGRKTRKELKAEADALIPFSTDPEYLYGGCPEACRTGRYSWAKPCVGRLANWGYCYLDEWAKTSTYINERLKAKCESCTENSYKLKQKAFATKNLDNATFLKWFTLVEQSWTAPGPPGWMRQNTGNCKVETAGWVKNALLSATYTFTMPTQTFCDERHSAPYAQGKFVHAPGYMADGEKKTQRCPPPLLGTVTLYCTSGTLRATDHSCHKRPTSPSMEGLLGYYKMLRGANYHGIEDGAAFAIAEMNRFQSHCPTLSWTKWSECNTSTPCERGVQSRTRDPIGISKNDPNCAEMMFYEERPCVGPGFCNQVLTRFIAGGTSNIESFLKSYKKQSTTIQSDKYASAGAHMLQTATPTCDDAKYWCKITTGQSKCGMYFEGHFQVYKDAEYYMSYEVDSGSGIIEFNTLGEGNELTAQYQVRAGKGLSMFEWQDLGFHHRRRRTDTKPWAAIGTLAMTKGTYFARMTRTGWSSCPTFQLRLEETSSVYAPPPLLGNNTIAAKMSGGAFGGSRQKTTSWDKNFRASDRRRWRYRTGTEPGFMNELFFSSELAGPDDKKVEINKLNFTDEELYGLVGINALNLPATITRFEKFELILRSTVVLMEAGEYIFKYQVDMSEKNKPWHEKSSRRRQIQFKMRVDGSNSKMATFNSYQSSATKSLSYTAAGPGTVSLEIAQLAQPCGPGYKMVMPNMMLVEMKKKDLLHGETLTIGSRTKYMSDLAAIRGDTQVRIDWPERDDPLSSELKTQTFQALYPQELLIGLENVSGFSALAEVVIDAGACASLEAWATPKTSDTWGVGMNLCDVDGANQYLEMVAYKPPTSNQSNYSIEVIGWVHIGFTQPTHMVIKRDPMNLEKFEFMYRPDNRLFYAKPFDSLTGTGMTGKVEVGVSMNSQEAYRYAEFYNISIEDCPSSCFDESGKQLYCGEITTACGNKLSCNSTCTGSNVCRDQMCMDCDPLVLTDAQKNWTCGEVSQLCTNIKGQKVQVRTAVGDPAPSAYHYCKTDGAMKSWHCIAKSKWAFLAEGMECGNVTDASTCGAPLDLFNCPMANDQCISHKCKCIPSSFDSEFNCGAEADGCGTEVYFGEKDGSCANANDRCSDNKCCTPKTKLDFPSTYQCGSESDGCGGSVAFAQASPEDLVTKPPESTVVYIENGQYGFRFTTKKAVTVGSLARGLMTGETKLLETSKVSLWDSSTRKKVASADIGPEAMVSKGYAWVNLETPVPLVKSRTYYLIQKVWYKMKDKFSSKYVSSYHRDQWFNTDYATLGSIVTAGSDTASYPSLSSRHRRRTGSGLGIVNLAFVENEGCGAGRFICHANHSCTEDTSKLPGFTVKSGMCKLNEDGTCVTSPWYPNKYPRNSKCVIETPPEGRLKAEYFNVENYFDKLIIKGRRYTNRYGPNLQLTRKENMYWYSDSIVHRKGWKICIKDVLQEASCPNLSGTYTYLPNGVTVTLNQTGCKGSSNAGWSYTVSGTQATIGNGITGTITGLAGTYVISWSNGYTYTQQAAT